MKYYKAEDVIRVIAGYLAWNDDRINKGKNDCIDNWEEWIEDAEDIVYNLQTIEASEDCVDRYSVLAELDPRSYEYKVVKELPSVIPKPKEGEWKFKKIFPNDDSEFPMGYLVCSVCGSQHANATPCNYCDNCGAKMKGVSE